MILSKSKTIILFAVILLGSFILIDKFFFRDGVHKNDQRVEEFFEQNDSIIQVVDESIKTLDKIQKKSTKDRARYDSLETVVNNSKRALSSEKRNSGRYKDQIQHMSEQRMVLPDTVIVEVPVPVIIEVQKQSELMIEFKDSVVFNYVDSTVYLIDTIERKVKRPLIKRKRERTKEQTGE